MKVGGIVSGDPILRFTSRIPLSPIGLGLTVSVAFNLLALVAALGAGCLRTAGNVMGFIDQPSTIPAIPAAAALFAFYFWVPRGTAAVFNGLLANKVVGRPLGGRREQQVRRITLSIFIRDMQAAFSRPWRSLASLLAAFVWTFLLTLPVYLAHMRAQDSCTTSTPVSLGLSLLWMVVNLYAVFSALSCCLLAVQWFNKLFRSFTINVRPLHPDGAGGLSPLGAFALRLSYPITLIGFILVLTPMTRQYLIDGSFRISLTGDIVAGLVLYAAFAPFVFFAPLAAAHSSMKQARFGTLLRLANQFDREYLNLEAGLAHSAKPAHARLQRISLLRSMYNEVRRFPVWPFNSDNLARFATSTVSPIALAVLGDATSRLFIG